MFELVFDPSDDPSSLPPSVLADIVKSFLGKFNLKHYHHIV